LDRANFGGKLMVTEQLGNEQVLAVRVGAGVTLRVAGLDPDGERSGAKGNECVLRQAGRQRHLR
jgi:hypothetical protein